MEEFAHRALTVLDWAPSSLGHSNGKRERTRIKVESQQQSYLKLVSHPEVKLAPHLSCASNLVGNQSINFPMIARKFCLPRLFLSAAETASNL